MVCAALHTRKMNALLCRGLTCLDGIHLALGNRVPRDARMKQVASELIRVSAFVHEPEG